MCISFTKQEKRYIEKYNLNRIENFFESCTSSYVPEGFRLKIQPVNNLNPKVKEKEIWVFSGDFFDSSDSVNVYGFDVDKIRIKIECISIFTFLASEMFYIEKINHYNDSMLANGGTKKIENILIEERLKQFDSFLVQNIFNGMVTLEKLDYRGEKKVIKKVNGYYDILDFLV